MSDYLDQLFNYEKLILGRTWIEIAWILLLIILALAMLVVLGRVLSAGSRGHLADQYLWTHCDNCGWTGEVSKFKKNCPICGERLDLG